ncbi:MAG: VWA domain-containing protein [Lentisphaerae bacterium]|nr:VWA domain-containing protein [Lentisphaerota bacterium]
MAEELVDNLTEQERLDLAKIAPEDRSFALLTGLGFQKLSKQRRRQLQYVFLVSLAIHVVGLAAFGGWVVLRHRGERATIFTTPPPSRTYEPRKLEHQVKIQKRQRSSSRPSMVPRLVSLKTSQIALPEIKMDPKIVHTTFQPKFKAVSGKGLGVGLGTGYGTDGFGAGVSSFNFFGIPARGERVAVLVDVSVSMVEEQRGGPQGFWRVKERLNQVVDSLNEGTLFTVIVFAEAAKVMDKEMLIASEDNKKKAKLFIRPFNTEGNWGLTQGNVSGGPGLQAGGGRESSTRLDLALTGAMLQGADTILVISDGIPRVKKVWSAEQAQAFQNQQAKWASENAAQMQAWNQANAAYQGSMQTVTERVWVPPTPAQPAIPPRPPSKQPPKEGQAPDRGDPGRPAQPAKPGYWKEVTRRVGGGGSPPGPRPQPPPVADPGWWTLTDFVEHITLLYNAVYVKQGRKPPVIHCIGYQIDDEGHAFLQDLSSNYRGQYRRVRQLK